MFRIQLVTSRAAINKLAFNDLCFTAARNCQFQSSVLHKQYYIHLFLVWWRLLLIHLRVTGNLISVRTVPK